MSSDEAALEKAVPVGTVVEIRTGRGFAYMQYTHYLRGDGQLGWVIPGLFSTRPGNLAALVEDPLGFFCLFPLDFMLENGSAAEVEAFEIPELRRSVPIFRGSRYTDEDGRGHGIWLYENGQQRVVAEMLTPELAKLPILSLPSPTALIHDLETGWRPEVHEERIVAERRRRRESGERRSSRVNATRHYLRFPDNSAAQAAAALVARLGGEAVVRENRAGGWLVLATPAAEWTRDDADAKFQRVAHQHGGDWDGTETKITQT